MPPRTTLPMRGLPLRFRLADDPSAGKTIVAGLLMKHSQTLEPSFRA